MENIAINQIYILIFQCVLVAILLLLFFRLRTILGLGLFYIAIGLFKFMHYFYTQAFSVELMPGLQLSIGSTVMYSGLLFSILLVYIRESAAEARKIIYALMIFNIFFAGILYVTGLAYGQEGFINRYNLPETFFLFDIRSLITGTIVIFLDAIALIMLYELFSRKTSSVFLRVFLTMSIVLVLHAVLFSIGYAYGTDKFNMHLVSGLLSKAVSVPVYSVLFWAYLVFIEKGPKTKGMGIRELKGIFKKFTYQQKIETILHEKAKIEETLKETEEKFAVSFRESMVGLAIIDSQGRYIEINKAFEKLLGIKREDLINKTSDEAGFLQEVNSASRKEVASIIKEEGKLVNQELYAELKNGKKLDALYSVEPVTIAGNQNWLLSMNDISGIKKAEARLRQSEKYLDNIINNIGDPVFVKDEESRLILVNDSFCRLFSLSREQIIGKTLAEDVPVDERESFLSIDKNVLETGIENINEEQLTIRGGKTLIIATRKSRYIDSSGKKFLVGTIRDITERKEAQDKILQLNKELEQRVKERTEALETANEELKEINDLFVGREARIIELKEEIEKLKTKINPT